MSYNNQELTLCDEFGLDTSATTRKSKNYSNLDELRSGNADWSSPGQVLGSAARSLMNAWNMPKNHPHLGGPSPVSRAFLVVISLFAALMLTNIIFSYFNAIATSEHKVSLPTGPAPEQDMTFGELFPGRSLRVGASRQPHSKFHPGGHNMVWFADQKKAKTRAERRLHNAQSEPFASSPAAGNNPSRLPIGMISFRSGDPEAQPKNAAVEGADDAETKKEIITISDLNSAAPTSAPAPVLEEDKKTPLVADEAVMPTTGTKSTLFNTSVTASSTYHGAATAASSSLQLGASWVGMWSVAYDNGFQTHYSIAQDGSVTASIGDDAGEGIGTFTPIEGFGGPGAVYGLKGIYANGKHERIWMERDPQLGEFLRIELFASADSPEAVKGVGVREDGSRGSTCVDDSDFEDDKGHACVAWKGYVCADAEAVFGYSHAGMEKVLSSCKASCEACGMHLATTFLERLRDREGAEVSLAAPPRMTTTSQKAGSLAGAPRMAASPSFMTVMPRAATADVVQPQQVGGYPNPMGQLIQVQSSDDVLPPPLTAEEDHETRRALGYLQRRRSSSYNGGGGVSMNPGFPSAQGSMNSPGRFFSNDQIGMMDGMA